MTTSSSSSPPSNTNTDTDTIILSSPTKTTAPLSTTAAAAKVAHHPPHHLRKTFFLEEEEEQVGNEEEEEQHQDIDLADTSATMMRGNNTDYRSTRTNNNDDNQGPFNNISDTFEMGADVRIDNNNNSNSSNKYTTFTSPLPSQRLTPQQQIDLHQLHHQHQHQPQQPNMQQPAHPSITEKHKKRHTSLPPVSSSFLQNQDLSKRRRSSSASWAHGEDGVPWSPWSRWRIVLKLLYAVVVPAVIIYLLKNMDETVASRHRQHHQDNQYFRHSELEGGGGRVSLWGHHRTTGVPSLVPVEPGAGSWWHRSSSTAGSDNSDEQHHHRCTGGAGVDEPRTQKKSYWFFDGDHHDQQRSC